MIAETRIEENQEDADSDLEDSNNNLTQLNQSSNILDSVRVNQLAESIGCHKTHLSKILNGLVEPKLPLILKLTNELNCSIEELSEAINQRRLNRKVVVYKGGRKLKSSGHIKSISDDKGKMTTREAGDKHGVSAEIISRIWKIEESSNNIK